MKILFMSQPDFACNPYALWKYIEENTNHETAWLVYKEEKYEELKKRGIKCGLYDTYAGNKLVEESDCIVANSYTFKNISKHEGQIFVNLWHGSGVKAHDYFDRNANVTYLEGIKKYFDKVDIMCVHSLDDRFRLSAMLNFDLRKSFVTGQPRLDCVVNSDGKQKLKKLFGSRIDNYDYLIFFAPSFRANMSGHSGTMLSSNIFRLNDYDDTDFNDFLKKNNAALIYKLHPIEQNAFKGRIFDLNDRCIELNDNILFEKEIQYDEILNAFNLMITDYSSIAFDYLLLDRPIVYLLPDYEEYKKSKGFVFNNIDYYMPGDKAFDYQDLITSIDKAIKKPDEYKTARQNVILQRFDYTDGQASKRCYETIMSFKPLEAKEGKSNSKIYSDYPTAADSLKIYLKDDKYALIDGSKPISETEIEIIKDKQEVIYITEETYDENARLSQLYKGKLINPEVLRKYMNDPKIHLCRVNGGVDFEMFSKNPAIEEKRKRIGFAGTIDARIYFAMVQVICEAFKDYEIVFAGEILGDYPAWLDSFDNLKYLPQKYEELPQTIATFDVCLLPFYGKHQMSVPNELFWFLAAGKCVVTSDMKNIPMCRSVFICKSIDESVEKIKEAFSAADDYEVKREAMAIAEEYDWKNISRKIMDTLKI